MRKRLAIALIITITLPAMAGAQTLQDIQKRLDSVVKKVETLDSTATVLQSPVEAVSQQVDDICDWRPQFLQMGDRDSSTDKSVSKLQIHLRDLGYFTYPEITGYFGPITKAALEQFQGDEGITATADNDSSAVTVGSLDANTAEYLMLRTCAHFEGTTTELEQVVMVDEPLANVYYNYEGGVYTFVGQANLPSACNVLDISAEIRESFPEQVSVRFNDQSILSNVRCMPTQTLRAFSLQIQVSEQAKFSAVYNDKPVMFSLDSSQSSELSKVRLEAINPQQVSLEGEILITGNNLEDVEYVMLQPNYYLKKYKFPYLRALLSKKEITVSNLRSLIPIDCSEDACQQRGVEPGTYQLFTLDFSGRPSNSLQIIVTE